MVLVGPSGCGKTTTLRMVAGLEEISEGEIRIGDRVVNALDPRERDVAMVFQNYALYPHMTSSTTSRFRCAHARSPKAEIRAARRADGAGCSGWTSLLERKPRAALRRPAPARRDGPGDRARAAGVPDGRAALEPRRAAARADARRDRAASSASSA